MIKSYFFQGKEGIRDHLWSRGLGDVKKRQKVALRTSGTEPKIKFYISVNETVNAEESYSSPEYLLKNIIIQIVLVL